MYCYKIVSYKDHKQPWSEPNACVATIVVWFQHMFQKSFVMWNNHRQVEGYMMKQNISIKKAMSQQFAYNKVILSKSVLTQWLHAEIVSVYFFFLMGKV